MTHTPTPAHQPGMTGGSMDEPWHWFTSTSDCGIRSAHDAHMWGDDRNWCKGVTR